MSGREDERLASALAARAHDAETASGIPPELATAFSACASLERDLLSAALVARGLPEGAGDWVFLRRLGRGPTGPVFLAEEPGGGRRAAVRVLEGPGAGAARAGADPSLRHPSIAVVLAVDDAFIACEPTGGVPLSQIIAALRREPPACWETAVRPLFTALAPIAGALAHAHAGGWVHAGVSPRKIDLRPDGTLRIRDFGFDPTSACRPPTPRAPPLGTPHHLAPEQVGGAGRPGAATDAWSFASTVYTVATGRHLFESRSLTGLMAKIRNAPLPRLPEPLADALEPMLVRDPSKREIGLAGIERALAG